MERPIGALWLKMSNNGKKFYSGNIEIEGKKIQIVAFPNDYKTKENQPDIQILLSKPKEIKGEQPAPADVPKEVIETNPNSDEEEVDIAKIPF